MRMDFLTGRRISPLSLRLSFAEIFGGEEFFGYICGMGKGNGFNEAINAAFIEASDGSNYVLRFDFFSKPGFAEEFMPQLDRALRRLCGAEDIYRNMRYEHKLLPPGMRRLVDVDTVAESLDCSLEEVLSLPAHIYSDITPLLRPRRKNRSFGAWLVVTSYYVCLHIRNVSFGKEYRIFFTKLCSLLSQFWINGLISPVDVQMLLSTTDNIADDAFRQTKTYNGFEYPEDPKITSKKEMEQLADGDTEYTVSNILVKKYVDNDIEEEEEAKEGGEKKEGKEEREATRKEYETVWTFSVSCVMITLFDAQDSFGEFAKRYPDIMLEGITQIERCAKLKE